MSWSGKQGKIAGALGAWLVFAFPAWIASVLAQTPDASLRGTVSDAGGLPLAGVNLTAIHSDTGFAQSAQTDSQGEYFLGSLPRGSYTLKVQMAGYRGLERQGIELAVGDKREENLSLPASSAGGDQAAANQLFQLISEPPSLQVETVASSVSVVVEENKILQLPLADRNIYSLFLLQPGVTSQGAVVSRGLTFSVHGQRVSGSNYLLDGLDNNNTVLTGPVAATSAEAIQEFRMVNSSFSSENGRATAFVAQVVTRSGGNRFHGSLFEFLANDKLNANTFENNAKEVSRPAFRRNQFGFSLGGPIKKNKTFFSSALEFSRLRFETTNDYNLPSASFISSLPTDSESRRLLTEFPPLPTIPTPEDPSIGFTRYRAMNRIDTCLATGRLDHQFSNTKDRLALRYTLASTEELDIEDGASPGYPSLQPIDPLTAHNSLLGWTHAFNAGDSNDLRIGWNREHVEQPRPRSDIPWLESYDFAFLPGNKRLLDRRENNNVIQVSDIFSVRRGRSALTAGFEYRRNLSNSIRLGLERDALGGTLFFPRGIYYFTNLAAFREDDPFYFLISVDRFSSNQLVDLYRKYRSSDYAGFIQNDMKLGRRLSLNVGLRYEYFGVPHNINRSQDVNFYFGAGPTIEQRLANGVLRSTNEDPGDLQGLLYRRDRLNFAPSIGLAWDPLGSARTIFRVGYAVAFDRVLDTVRDLRSNNQQLVACAPPECPLRFLIPPERLLASLDTNQPVFQEVVQLDENLRTPYAQNWYIGVQQTVTSNFLVEIGHAGSVGRKLISRDVINRSINGLPPPNPEIGDDTFLSNAGNSNYVALELGLRRRFSRGLQFQVSYTYSHGIDNQSDVLEGVRTGPRETDVAIATFTRQLDPRLDRGSANFDQRQNLVFNAVWDLPDAHPRSHLLGQLFGGWTTSVIGAYRSGFPVTVINSFLIDPTSGLYNNRVDYLGSPGDPAHLSSAPPVAGGVQWLDPTLFQPALGRVGSLGRGSVRGPGFWNYDFALLRRIALMENRLQMQFRVEFYNLFNHANLSAPRSVYSDPFTGEMDPEFGRAYFGVNRRFSRFGDLPLQSPSRTIQFGLRIQF